MTDKDLPTKPLPGSLPDEVKALPDILLSYQQELLATTAANLVVFCEKSRRIGITWAVGADATMVAASSKKANGMNVYYMGYNLEMAREFINVCADWAKIFNQACSEVEDCIFEDIDAHGETRKIKAFRIQFASGFEVIALPSSARSLRGMQGFVIVDEAAFHDDLEEVLKAAYALLMWGGRVLVISTHDGADNVFNQQIQAIKEKRKGFRKHKLVTITFTDAVNNGLYERICLVKGVEPTADGKEDFINEIYEFYGDGASEELDVIPRKSGGVYFPAQLVEPSMIDVPVVTLSLDDDFFPKPNHEKERYILDWCVETLKPILDKLDKELSYYFGFDCGRTTDLSVYAPLCISKNTARKSPLILEMRNVPFTNQEQILYYITDRLPNFRVGMLDGTGLGAMLAEKMEERYGRHRIRNVKINVGWYEEALPKYKGAMQDKHIFIPKDANILQDHRTAKVVSGVPQIPRLKDDQGKSRHGDSLVALAGAYWSTLQEVGEYDYEAVFPNGMDHTGNLQMKPRHEDEDAGFHRSKNFGNNRGAY